MSASAWLQRLSPLHDAPARLFCFHHAGGSAASYRLWPRHLPDVDVCAVQLPGRANRFGEPPLDSLPALVDALLPALRPLLDRPFAFFGHSMGTALAWEVTRRLHALGETLPAHLFMSGRQPPHKPYAEESLRGLSDAQVLRKIVDHYDGLPPEVLANLELLEMLLPALRADFAALEDYAPPPPRQPLPVPVTVLGGLADPCSATPRLAPWQAYTRLPLATCLFPGNHFYLDDQSVPITRLVRRTLIGGLGGTFGREAA